MKKIVGIIPARYASSRFPGKPLADIKGKSMIQRVFERASLSKRLENVYVATDHPQIFEHVQRFTDCVIMTGEQHINGTERCYEAACQLNEIPEVVINIQGDEPMIYPQQIDQLAAIFDNDQTEIATLIMKIQDMSLAEHKGVVKVVQNMKGQAMYFSRAAIPFYQTSEKQEYHKHIGLYGYQMKVLEKLVRLSPTVLEQAESLEQLRWIENGYTIHCAPTDFESKSIDTPEDLAYVLRQMELNNIE